MRVFVACLVVAWTCSFSSDACAQMEFEAPPIDYHAQGTADPVAQLQARIDSGEVTLRFSDEQGYLPAVLENLGISTDSQVLVFSQTSFQLRKISPDRPRAVYFNDNNYIGWCQFGDVVEVSSVDPQLGAIFYTLAQEKTDKPKFIRDKGQCLTCHASSRTQGVPGHLVRSVFPDRGGVPLLGSGTFTTDHKSPFEERWGGWYVTGKHGDQRHMGNAFVLDKSEPEKLDREAGANLAKLDRFFDVAPYLSPHSDLVALMVIEHQSQMHNLITRAAFEARMAEHHDQLINQALGRPATYRSESTQRRIASVSQNLLKYMLMSGEYRLTTPVSGTSRFAEKFATSGPRDAQGRSLRELDLQTRLFKYPCSYLIYSPSFDQMPEAVKDQVYAGLWKVLAGEDTSEDYQHLRDQDRQAIREILLATKPDFAARKP